MCLLMWKRETNVGPCSDFIYSPPVSLQLDLLQRVRLANSILNVLKLPWDRHVLWSVKPGTSRGHLTCPTHLSQDEMNGFVDGGAQTTFLLAGCVLSVFNKMNSQWLIPLFLWSPIKEKSKTKLLWRPCLWLVQLHSVQFALPWGDAFRDSQLSKLWAHFQVEILFKCPSRLPVFPENLAQT